MQCYFEYKIYGNEKELNDVINQISLLINKKKSFKQLMNYNLGTHYNPKNNNFVLTFSNEECCELLGVFDFDDMMYDLSKMFIHLEINGYAYIKNSGYYSKWHKDIGDLDYEIDDKIEVVISIDDYDESNNIFNCYIDIFDIDIEINADLFKDINKNFINKKYIYNFEKFNIEVLFNE